jgi:tetratricopeptide (TPR) repeat protein
MTQDDSLEPALRERLLRFAQELDSASDPAIVLSLCRVLVAAGHLTLSEAFGRASSRELAEKATVESGERLCALLQRAQQEPNGGLLLADLIESHARSLAELQRGEMAVRLFEAILPFVEKEASQERLATAQHNFAGAMLSLERCDDAERLFGEAIRIRRSLVEDVAHSELAIELARSLVMRGLALATVERLEEAAQDTDDAIAILEWLMENEDRPQLSGLLAATLVNQGRTLEGLERFDDAARDYDKAIRLLQVLITAGDTQYRGDLAAAQLSKGCVMLVDDPVGALSLPEQIDPEDFASEDREVYQSTLTELLERLKSEPKSRKKPKRKEP